MRLFAGYSYDKWFRVNAEVEVLFRDAGHILGSASVTLRIKENGETKLFGFSGDMAGPIGRSFGIQSPCRKWTT
jgi:metallo-beta-lactamase family protein